MSFAFGAMLMSATSGAICVAAETTAEFERIEATNREVRDAFKEGDIERIALFHHENVIKSLGPDRYFEGKDALKEDLANTFAAVDLEFGEEEASNVRESITMCGDTVISIVRFAIGWRLKDGSADGVARGRAMLVQVRSDDAPYGWVTLREVVQPLP